MRRLVHAQDGLRRTFFVVIGLHSVVGQEVHDAHVDFGGKYEMVQVHDEMQEVDKVDGSSRSNVVFHC